MFGRNVCPLDGTIRCSGTAPAHISRESATSGSYDVRTAQAHRLGFGLRRLHAAGRPFNLNTSAATAVTVNNLAPAFTLSGTDTLDYGTATKTVTLVVNQLTPKLR